MASGMINQKHTIGGAIKAASAMSGSTSAGGGSTDHSRLYNRDADDQHPISAITDLQDALDEKLDSETALPLIEEAVKYKAKGLFYDINCELSKKAYWYLTSEIDPETKMGTKASVISGPYDLGSGGGGGGGTTTVTLEVATDETTGKKMWPYNVAMGSECIIGFNWSSIRDEKATGKGTFYIYVNSKLVETSSKAQGLVTFEISDYLVSGENKVEVKVIDAYSTTKNLIDTISGITLKLSSNFEDNVSYTGNITFPYIPYGDITKYVYFFVDGVQQGDPETVTTSGEQWTRLLPKALFSHGAHTLKVYFTCIIDDETVKSNELYYDIIYYESGKSTPIIASPFVATQAEPYEGEQYVSFNIKYRVYTPNRNTSDIYLYSDGTLYKNLTVGQAYQTWECRFDVVGNHTLEIRTGSVSKIFYIHTAESTIHVDPVTQGLALALSSYGRDNTEPLETRQKWDYTYTSEGVEHTIEGKLTGFNWTSNGWVKDTDGNTVLRLSGDSRLSIEYKPFESDFTSTGKTFEFEIATSDVKGYEARIGECLDGADTINYSQSYAGEDTRTKRFLVDSVDNEKFIAKVLQEKGTYIFKYNGTAWDLDGTILTSAELESEYGIVLKSWDVETGATGEISPEYLMENDRATVYYTVSGRGFYITPQLAKLQSNQASLSTQYKENEKVRLSFVVESRTAGSETFKTKLIYMYINGIMSGVSRYPDGDSFQQNPAQYITFGSNDATIDIYNLRIYDQALTRTQVVNNWIADTKDPVLKAKRYKRNDNFEDNKITVNKINALGDLPYLVAEVESLPSYKKDRKYASISYTNPADDERNFTAENARMDVQGTSSQYYYRKNFKIKYEDGFYDKNLSWDEHYHLRGADLSKKEKTFTYKADVASSEGANNVELVRYFEDSKNWYSPAELEPDEDLGTDNSKLRIRAGIDGLPIVMFHNDGTTTSFYGKMNFNNDKDNKRTFGFDDGDESWEFLHNTSDLVLFRSNDLIGSDPTKPLWQDSFESRYPETAGDDEHAYGTLESERVKLQAVMDWVVSTYRKDTDTEEEKAAKLAKFKSELSSHFNLTSTLFYYLFTELFLLVDSRAKNAMMTYLKSRQDGDGGNRWFWFPYDMDTAIGTNNEGLLVYDYDKEDTDLQEGAYIFNGQNSVFWMNVRDAFQDELQSMYNTLRSSGTSEREQWTYDNIENRFEEHQAVWSENIFNEDSQIKYLEPYINNQDATYLGMAQGSKAEQRKWWLYNRFRYIDSKYLSGDAKDTTIMLRAYAKGNFKITPYLNCYATAIFDQATAGLTVTEKVEKGVAKDLISPSSWDPKGVDSVVVLYSADLLQDIGDISAFKPGYADFSSATKLQRLQIGSASSSYENGNLRGLNVGANKLLTYLDARNCKNLGLGDKGSEVTPTIDLSQCTSIEEVYFDNTQIKGCLFPTGGNLKVAHLPETLTSLTIRNHPNLEDLQLAGTNVLQAIWLEDIPSEAISAYEIVMGEKINSVRLINIDETFTDDDTYTAIQKLKAFYAKLNSDDVHGVDENGDYTAKAQVTGKVRIAQITYSDWAYLSGLFPEVEIIAAQIICTVTFNYNDRIVSESVPRGSDATTPGILLSKPADWAELAEWDWDDASYFEENQFKPETHTHYLKYYQKNEDGTYSRLVAGTEFEASKYYTCSLKEATNTTYYSFVKWDTDYTSVQTDLTINPIYTEGDTRKYIVTYDTQSGIVSLPLKEEVYYDTKCHFTAFDESTIPEGVSFNSWRLANSNEFRFTENTFGSESEETITGHLRLYAKWNDANVPVITLTRSDYKTVHYKITDNVGVTGWAITNTTTEPTEWTPVEHETLVEGDYVVPGANQYYFWAKDAVGNITDPEASMITAYAISKTFTPVEGEPESGIESLVLTEVDTTNIIGEFALHNTNINIACTIDSHYKDLVLKLNGEVIENNSDIKITEAFDFIATSTPQQYAVYFHMMGRGTSVPTQVITYLHKVIVPDPQIVYDSNVGKFYIIDGWYKEEALTNEWDFDTDVVNADVLQPVYGAEAVILFANWVKYDTPTKITISTTEDNQSVTLNYIQSESQGVTVNWGDGSAVEKATSIDHISLGHIYTTKGQYTIETSCIRGQYYLGDGSSQTKPAIMPISIVKEVDFAWDVPYTANYAFCGAYALRKINLTPYMTKVADGTFWNCTAATIDKIPDNILSIGGHAFGSCVNFTGVLDLDNPKLKTIGTGAFQGCTGVTEIKLADTVTELGEYAFASCTNLTTINIPSKLGKISKGLFDSCIKLTKLDLPNTVQVIGAQAFANCQRLSKLVIRNAYLTFENEAFSNCYELNSAGPIGGDYNLEYSWTDRIPAYAFAAGYNQNFFRSITLPENLVTIGNYAFWYGSNINWGSLVLPSGVTSIGTEAFARNTMLSTIDLPSTINQIGHNAFTFCSGLTRANIRNTTLDEDYKVNTTAYSWFRYANTTSELTLHISSAPGFDPDNIFGPYWNWWSDTAELTYTNDL